MGGFLPGCQHLNNNETDTIEKRGVFSVKQTCHNRDRNNGILSQMD